MAWIETTNARWRSRPLSQRHIVFWPGAILAAGMLLLAGCRVPSAPPQPFAATTAPTRAPSAPASTATAGLPSAAAGSTPGTPGPRASVPAASAATPGAALGQLPAATISVPGPAAEGDKGITFGKPVVLGTGAVNSIGVLATNTTDLVKTFTVRATYNGADGSAATAVGGVHDLPPGQTRAVQLISAAPVPASLDTLQIHIENVIQEAATTAGAAVAARMEFGQPVVKPTSGVPNVDVTVKNVTDGPHTFVVQAAFLKGDQLVGLATGKVNDLAPGQSTTATLTAVGPIPAYDKVLVGVDTVFG